MTTRENLKEKFNYTKDKIKKLAVVPNSIKNFYDFIYNHPKYSSLLFFTFIYLIVYILFLFNPSKFLNDYFYKKYNDYTNFSNIIITLALFSLLMVIMFKTYNIILNERNFSEQFKIESNTDMVRSKIQPWVFKPTRNDRRWVQHACFPTQSEQQRSSLPTIS